MKKITTAIEIKRNVLRILQIKKSFKEITVLNSEEERLPFTPALELGENLELIATKLRSMFPRLSYVPKNPVFVMPTSEIMVRFFDLPYLGKQERGEAIKYEAQKYIPFPVDDIVSDFYIPYEIKGKEMRVVFMAVKREILNRYLTIAESLELKLSAIEPYPFSLLRALFTSGDLKTKDFVLVLDLDYSGSTILVTEGLHLYIVRDFVFSASFETFSEEATNKIVFEINRTIDYMIKEFPHQSIKELILSGEAADESIRDILMQRLNLTVELASLESKIGGQSPEESRKFLGLSGACLKDLINYAVDLDFFIDYQEKVQPHLNFNLRNILPRQLVRDIILIFLAILGVNFYLQHQFGFIKKMAARTPFPDMISSLNRKKLKMEIKDERKKIGFYKNILGNRIYFTNLFNFIPRSLISGIWLDNLELKTNSKGGPEVLLQGYGYNRGRKGVDIIYDFLENINNSEERADLFRDVKLTNVEKVDLKGYKVIKFALRMVLK